MIMIGFADLICFSRLLPSSSEPTLETAALLVNNMREDSINRIYSRK
jgi:hypothetical protein